MQSTKCVIYSKTTIEQGVHDKGSFIDSSRINYQVINI